VVSGKAMKKAFVVSATVVITIAFWMLVTKAVTGCYTAICGK
jgi:hypothetical protein